MTRLSCWFTMGVVLALPVHAQSSGRRPPVVDMHVHSTTTTPAAIPRFDSLNVRYWFLSGLAADLRTWQSVDSARYLPGLVFPCDRGRAPITGRPCFDTPSELPDTTWLRAEIKAGRLRAFGELSPQFLGMSPADPRLEPYFAHLRHARGVAPRRVHDGTPVRASNGVRRCGGPVR